MRKRQRGRTLPNKSRVELQETVLAVKQYARVEFGRVMEKSSTMSDTTVEAVSITFRLVLLVGQQTGVVNHLDIRWIT